MTQQQTQRFRVGDLVKRKTDTGDAYIHIVERVNPLIVTRFEVIHNPDEWESLRSEMMTD